MKVTIKEFIVAFTCLLFLFIGAYILLGADNKQLAPNPALLRIITCSQEAASSLANTPFGINSDRFKDNLMAYAANAINSEIKNDNLLSQIKSVEISKITTDPTLGGYETAATLAYTVQETDGAIKTFTVKSTASNTFFPFSLEKKFFSSREGAVLNNLKFFLHNYSKTRN